MTDTIKVIDFINDKDRGHNILPDFLKKDPNLKTFFNSFMDEVQEFYDELKNFSESSLLTVAEDFILDQYGERVGLEREQGQSNDDYRVAITSQIKSTTAHGSVVQLVDLYAVFTLASSVSYDRIGLRSIILSATVESFAGLNESQIILKMLDVIAAGVGVELSLSLVDRSFLFAENDDNIVPANRGFSLLDDGSDGGQMDHLL